MSCTSAADRLGTPTHLATPLAQVALPSPTTQTGKPAHAVRTGSLVGTRGRPIAALIHIEGAVSPMIKNRAGAPVTARDPKTRPSVLTRIGFTVFNGAIFTAKPISTITSVVVHFVHTYSVIFTGVSQTIVDVSGAVIVGEASRTVAGVTSNPVNAGSAVTARLRLALVDVYGAVGPGVARGTEAGVGPVGVLAGSVVLAGGAW